MRIENVKNDGVVDLKQFIGWVCTNSIGRIGIVISIGEAFGKPALLGMGIDGRGNWCSTGEFCVIDTAEGYRKTLQERFDGRLSYNA
jgi:hypothetical protein